MLTPQQVVNHFGSVGATARFFSIKPSAVYQWLEKNKLPHRRELELMLKKPQNFPQDAQ
jgi:hypothetical protein